MLKASLAFKIQKRDKFICQYCGKDGLVSLENWHDTVVDHFDPSKGNTENNLFTSCHYCNAIKGKKVFKSIQEVRDYIKNRKKQLYKNFLKVVKEIRGVV